MIQRIKIQQGKWVDLLFLFPAVSSGKAELISAWKKQINRRRKTTHVICEIMRVEKKKKQTVDSFNLYMWILFNLTFPRN